MEQEHREPEGVAGGWGDTSVPWRGWARAGSGQGKGRQGLGWGELSPGEFVTEGLQMGLIPPAPLLGDPPSSGRASARGVPSRFGGRGRTHRSSGRAGARAAAAAARAAAPWRSGTGGHGGGTAGRDRTSPERGQHGKVWREAVSARRGRVSTNGAEIVLRRSRGERGQPGTPCPGHPARGSPTRAAAARGSAGGHSPKIDRAETRPNPAPERRVPMLPSKNDLIEKTEIDQPRPGTAGRAGRDTNPPNIPKAGVEGVLSPNRWNSPAGGEVKS